MVEGPAGIITISPPWYKPTYISSKRRLEWANGAQAHLYSAEEPDALRGPEHEKAWVDEIIKFKYAQETMDMMMFGLRLGEAPQVIITTTPKPIKIIREIVTDSMTHITVGSTYENKSNLAKTFFDRVIKKYEGTRLGEQELHAKILDDNPNALWDHKSIDETRVIKAPDLVRIAVAIDPAVTSNATSAETGIIVGGIDEHGHGFVLDDLTLIAKAEIWAAEAVKGYHRRDGDIIIGEVNNGGDLIEAMIRIVDPNVNYKPVRATKGKFTRAEPVAALYEKGRIHHVGMFADLEEQLCEWVPGEKSPDRLDALVWLFTELLVKDEEIEHDYSFY
jgi:phage terminase large subunit-like protein